MRRDPATARGVTSRLAIGMRKPCQTVIDHALHPVEPVAPSANYISGQPERKRQERLVDCSACRLSLLQRMPLLPRTSRSGAWQENLTPPDPGPQLSAIGGRTVLRSVPILPDDAGRSFLRGASGPGAFDNAGAACPSGGSAAKL